MRINEEFRLHSFLGFIFPVDINIVTAIIIIVVATSISSMTQTTIRSKCRTLEFRFYWFSFHAYIRTYHSMFNVYIDDVYLQSYITLNIWNSVCTLSTSCIYVYAYVFIKEWVSLQASTTFERCHFCQYEPLSFWNFRFNKDTTDTNPHRFACLFIVNWI